MNAFPKALSAAGLPGDPEATLFRAIAEQWPGAVLVFDCELRVRWANARCAALLSKHSTELIGARWRALDLPWALTAPQLRNLLRGSPEKLLPATHTATDGAQRLCEARLIPLVETAGVINAVLLVIEEVPGHSMSAASEAGTASAESAAIDTQTGSWHWDFASRFFSVDARWCRAMNVDPCQGRDHRERWAQSIHPDDATEFRRKSADIEAGRSDRIEIEYRMLTHHSRWLWVLQRGQVVDRREDGTPLRVTGVCIEIDDRKRAEVALQENEARLATALWGARAAFWQWHIATDTVTMSPLWFAITGYTREQWDSLPRPLIARIHPEDRERALREIRNHLDGQSQSIEVEFRVRTASGDWKWVLMRGRVIEWDFDGRATSAIGVSLDIDGEKRAQLALRSTEARLETAVWGAGIGLWELDFRTDSTRWFSDWCDRQGFHPCEGKGHVSRWDANIHPDDVNEAVRRFDDHIAGKEDYYDAEYRIRDKHGLWRWLFERGRVVERASDGTALRMVGVCMDIDARKESELELIKTQRRLEAALESARGGMWDWDLTRGEANHTDFYYRMLGVEPEQGRREPAFWSSRVHPEDLPRVHAALQRTMDGGAELYEAEYRLRHADGTWRWVLDRGRAPERDESGRATRLVGFVMDITDRVQTQEALRKSEFRYRTVASLTPGYVFEYRFNDKGEYYPVFMSDGLQDVYGCTVEEFIRRGGWEAFSDPECAETARQNHQRLLNGEVQDGEVRVRTVDGKRKWLRATAMPVRDPQSGALVGFIGAAYDITKRKLAEQAVRESEAVLRAVTENTPDWLFLIDEQLCVRFMNRNFGSFNTEEAIGRSLLDAFPAVHRAPLEALYRRVFTTGEPGRVELREPRLDGGFGYLEHRVMPVVESGNVHSLTVAVTDITESRRADLALRESQSVLKTVAESSADWLALFDRQGRCVFVNRSINNMSPEAWVGRGIEEFASPEDQGRGLAIFEHVLATGEPQDFEQVVEHPQLGTRRLEVRARAVKSDGRILGVVANITDVTQRYSQENILRTQARILETMREGVVLVDADNRIGLTNATFDSMFGYGSGELLGQSVEPLFSTPPVQRKRIERSLRDSSAALEKALPVEFECARRDGTRFVASCVITPLNMGGKEHWLAVLNDVTERKRLEREIIEIANREQQRIGSDLHDGLGQDLTGIALMLSGVAAQLHKEGSAARLDVEDVISLVNNAIESTRALARGLSPVSAERGGLTAALHALAAKAGERYAIRVEFSSRVTEPLRLDETAATHLYRIAQEALTNVIRHSLATEVRIRLETAGDELHLKIEDNGRGFMQKPAEASNGLGLKIMRYRAQMLGGDLVLEAAVNGGASVRCTCPLAPSGFSERERAIASSLSST